MDRVELAGQRVKLVPLERDHVDALFAAAAHPEIWHYMPNKVETLEQMLSVVEEALAKRQAGTEYPFVVIDRQTGLIVGSTRFLDIAMEYRNLEIGWTWYAPEVWRTRVNTECKYLLLRHCFEHMNLIRVMFKTDARNVRSQTAIERLGALREGVLRRHRILPDGYIRDSVVFSIISDEWPQVKQRLEAFLTEN